MSGRKYIGLDVHQETVAIAVADEGNDREVRYFGTVSNRPEALHAALKKIAQGGFELCVCYESGPCGFVIYRYVRKVGIDCTVIYDAASRERPDQDRPQGCPDAGPSVRAGELVAVWVPDEAHEAIRDVVRARRQAKTDLSAAKAALRESPVAP